MTTIPITPRPLSAAEPAVISKLLSGELDCAATLREQIPLTEVVTTWGAGSPSVDLAVPPSAPRAALPDGELPVSGQVHDEHGAYIGEVTLWVTNGALSAIEYSWVTDCRPSTLPHPDRMTIQSTH